MVFGPGLAKATLIITGIVKVVGGTNEKLSSVARPPKFRATVH